MHAKDGIYLQFNDHETVGGLYKNNMVFWSRNRSQIIYRIGTDMDFITQFTHLVPAAKYAQVYLIKT